MKITNRQRLIALLLFIIMLTGSFGVFFAVSPNRFEIMTPGNTAYIIDSTKISIGFYNYFFQTATNLEYLLYLETQDSNFDSTIALDEQFYDEEKGITWYDYFSESAFEQVRSIVKLYNCAVELGLELAEEQKRSIDEQLSDLKVKANEQSISLNDYISIVYADYAGEKTYRKITEMFYLAQNYCEYMYVDDDFALQAYQLADSSLNNVQCSVKEIFIPFDEDDDSLAVKTKNSIIERLELSENPAYLFSIIFNCYMQDSDYYASDNSSATVLKGESKEELDKWLFAEQRKTGDYILLESKSGFHIICYMDSGENFIKRTELAKDHIKKLLQKSEVKTGFAFKNK